jgi:hypothetical protein
MTFTGFIGKVCMFPLRAIIKPACAAHPPEHAHAHRRPDQVAAACALGFDRFILAGSS